MKKIILSLSIISVLNVFQIYSMQAPGMRRNSSLPNLNELDSLFQERNINPVQSNIPVPPVMPTPATRLTPPDQTQATQEVFHDPILYAEFQSKKDQFFKIFLHSITFDQCLSSSLEEILKNSNPAVARALVNHKFDYEFLSADKRTPLLLSTARNDKTAIEILLRYQADINALNEGYAPIHIAVEHAPQIIPFLVQHKADVELRTAEGITPLMLACQAKGKIEAIEPLLNAGAAVTQRSASYTSHFGKSSGLTCLHIACVEYQYKKVKLLLEKGANVHETDNCGNPPLFYAMGYLSDKILQLLFENGARAHHTYADGTALIDRFNHPDKLKGIFLFFEHGAPCPKKTLIKQALGKGLQQITNELNPAEHSLFEALFNENISVFNTLVKQAKSNELNAKDSLENTLLIWAVIRNNAEAFSTLLTLHDNDNAFMRTIRSFSFIPFVANPINIHDRGDYGRTALHWAALLGNKRFYHELLKHSDKYGVIRLIRDSKGKIALNHAVDCGHLELFKAMLFERPSIFRMLHLEHKYASEKSKIGQKLN